MGSIKILVVEDEIIIAEDIVVRLLNMGYDIAHMVNNVDEAIDCLESIPLDLVLIDIALMGERTGIDLANIINSRYKIPFIYLTSISDKNTVKNAGETNPAAYLLKPFNDRQVHISIEVALMSFYGDKNEDEEIQEIPDPDEVFIQKPDALFLKKDSHYEKVEYGDILWLEADSNYTFIFSKSGRYTYSTVLKNFENKLPGENFIRVHRSYIVNLDNVTGLEGNMLLVGEKHIPVSKACRDEVFKRFQMI